MYTRDMMSSNYLKYETVNTEYNILPTRAFAKNSNIFWITSELNNMSLNPLQGFKLIQDAVVSCSS